MTLSHRESVGIATQSTLGTAVTPTHLLPVTSFSATEEFENIEDNGRRGPDALNFRSAQGVKVHNITMEGVVQPDPGTGLGFAVGLLLHSVFGGASATAQIGVTGVYNHDFQLLNTKDYLTVEHDTKITAKARQFEGCRVTNLTFSWDAGEGALRWSATLIGRDMSLVTATDLSAQVTTIEDPLAGWRAYCHFNAAMPAAWSTAAFARMLSAEWSLTREGSIVYSGKNSQLYNDLYLGPLAVSVALKLDYIDDTELALFRANTQGIIVNAFSIGSGTSLRRFVIGGPTFTLLGGPAELDSSGANQVLGLTAGGLYSEATSPITPDSGVTSDTAADTMSGPVQVRLTDLKSAAY